MVLVGKKSRQVVIDDDEPEQATRDGKIIIARTIKRSDVPRGRGPGARNPEYDKLVRRLIRLEMSEKAAVVPVASKSDKVKIREGIRKPLRVRGYDLTAITDYDDELGEVLMLFATKRDSEEPEDEEEIEPETEEDDEDEEEVIPVRKKKKVRSA